MNLANRLTLSRILMTPLFIASLLYFSPERPYFHTLAVFIYLAACLTDALDGYLARKLKQETTLGRYIDPIADKLLLLSGYVSLSLMTNLPARMHVPAWLTLTVISRDVMILVGSMIIFIVTGSLKPTPLYVGKLTTVIQMAALLISLMGFPRVVCFPVYVLTAGLTFISGVYYFRTGGQMFQESQ